MGGNTLGTPVPLRIFSLFCCYATVFKDYFLFRYIFKYNFNSVSKFIIIFLSSILFSFFPNVTVRQRNLGYKVIL